MTLWSWSKTAADNDDADATINAREGMAPSLVNNGMRAIMAAVAKYRDDRSGVLATGGSASAYTLTTNQVYGSLADGISVSFRAAATNSAGPTLNVDGLGAKPLRFYTGTSLAAGRILIGSVYSATYRLSTDEWLVNGADGATADIVADLTKLDGIETAADVTDAGNVGSSIHGASAKTTPVDADTLPLIDSAASNVLKKVTFANLKAAQAAGLQTTFDARYGRIVASGTISSAATLDINFSSFSSYGALELRIDGIAPATDDVELYCRLSVDGGSNFLATTYAWHFAYGSTANTASLFAGGVSDAEIPIFRHATANLAAGNDTGEEGSLIIRILGSGNASSRPAIFWESHWKCAGANMAGGRGGAHHGTAAAFNAIRLYFESGNIAKGNWVLVGIP